MSTTLRPNAATIERRSEGPQSQTGSIAPAITTTINTAIPARIEPVTKADLAWLVEGSNFVQAALMILDGIPPSQFQGVAPGGSVVVGGITYIVEHNGQAAFPSVLKNDRVTDEDNAQYLVLAVTRYFVTRTLQAQIVAGRAWS